MNPTRHLTSLFAASALLVGVAHAQTGADQPSPRTDNNSKLAHDQLLEKAKKGGVDVYMEGDSIARRWGTSDANYKDLLANWNQNFFGWNVGDFGWGADTIQNILWRLNNGELDGVNPKVIVVLAGTNNVGAQPGNDAKVADITKGLKAIIDICQKKAPNATIIMTAIFPRNDRGSVAVVPTINKINDNLAKFADGKKIRYLNVNDKLADSTGKVFAGMLNAGDQLHPTVKGYQVWADGLKPILTELLGPPAKTDHAPPPTGDPSATAPATPRAGRGGVQVPPNQTQGTGAGVPPTPAGNPPTQPATPAPTTTPSAGAGK